MCFKSYNEDTSDKLYKHWEKMIGKSFSFEHQKKFSSSVARGREKKCDIFVLLSFNAEGVAFCFSIWHLASIIYFSLCSNDSYKAVGMMQSKFKDSQTAAVISMGS